MLKVVDRTCTEDISAGEDADASITSDCYWYAINHLLEFKPQVHHGRRRARGPLRCWSAVPGDERREIGGGWKIDPVVALHRSNVDVIVPRHQRLRRCSCRTGRRSGRGCFVRRQDSMGTIDIDRSSTKDWVKRLNGQSSVGARGWSLILPTSVMRGTTQQGALDGDSLASRGVDVVRSNTCCFKHQCSGSRNDRGAETCELPGRNQLRLHAPGTIHAGRHITSAVSTRGQAHGNTVVTASHQ